MHQLKSTRRAFLRNSLTAAAGLALIQPEGFLFGKPSKALCQTLRLGAPSFAKTDDPDEMAIAHRKLGYRAAFCPQVALNDAEKIRAIEQSFAKHDVVISEVGRWCNLMDANPGQRRKNLDSVTEGLALAEAVGALCCVDIAGSYNPSVWFGPHPDNLSRKHFDASVENARKIIDAVKPKRAKFCYEMMGWMSPDSPDSYLKMIKAVDRPAFAVHVDICNLINSPTRFYNSKALVNECFEKLGRWIVSCHAKDLAWEVEMNVHFREVIPGKGSLDYVNFLRHLAKLPQNPPLMLEHLATAEEYSSGRDYLFRMAARLSFGLESPK